MKGKCYLKLIQTRKGIDELSLNERLIYSYLVSKGSARQSDIAEWLGIGINTVTRCCGKQGSLVKRHKLVARTGGRVVPLEPGDIHEGWFPRFHQDERGWRKAFKYIKVYMPSEASPLRLRDHIVLSVLYGMARTASVIPRVTPQYLVEVLGIAHRTAGAALHDLQEHHLILLEDNPGGAGHTVTLGGLDAQMQSWFRQATPRRDAAGPTLPRIASMYSDGHRPDLKEVIQIEAEKRSMVRSRGEFGVLLGASVVVATPGPEAKGEEVAFTGTGPGQHLGPVWEADHAYPDGHEPGPPRARMAFETSLDGGVSRPAKGISQDELALCLAELDIMCSGCDESPSVTPVLLRVEPTASAGNGATCNIPPWMNQPPVRDEGWSELFDDEHDTLDPAQLEAFFADLDSLAAQDS